MWYGYWLLLSPWQGANMQNYRLIAKLDGKSNAIHNGWIDLLME